MSFGAPEWLWALLMLPFFILVFIWNEMNRAELLRKVIAARLQERLAGSVSTWRRRLRFLFLMTGWTFIVLSLARPQLGYTWEQAKRKGRDIIIAIDTSRSMLAGDLPPNRLTRAKLAAQDLLALLESDRVGVIAFAGSAFLQAPLTVDYGAVLETINELDTEIIPRGGTNIAEAIRVAANAFGKGESENRALIIFTDGEELDADAMDAARQYAEELRVFTVGVGTESGSVIPVPDEGGGTSFVKDPQGQIVKSRLDEEKLQRVAEATGGFYVRLQSGPEDMERILSKGLGQLAERELDTRMSRRPIERYQWPLALGLIFLVSSLFISERKRFQASAPVGRRQPAPAIAMLAMLAFLPAAQGASGVELYNQQQYEQAYQIFQKQLERQPRSEALEFDLGTAAYKLGKYDKALESFGKAITSDNPELRTKAQYNLGNTLLQRGLKREEKEAKLEELRSALKHYEQALALAPEYDDAKHNRDVVRGLIEELEKEQPPPPEQQKQEQEQEEESQEQEEQQQDQQQAGSKQQKEQQPSPDEQRQEQESQQPDQQQEQQGDQRQDQQQQAEQEQAEQQPSDQAQEEQQQGEDSAQQPGDQQQDEQQERAEGQSEDQQEPEQQPEQEAQDQTGQQPSQQPSTPAPAPQLPERKLEGELRAEGALQPEAEPQPVEETEQPGEMSQAQAAALLESLRDEDEQVSLYERRSAAPVIRDW